MALLRNSPPPRPRPKNALSASGERIDLKSDRALAKLRRRREQWQEEAWAYFDEVGEIKYGVRFKANAISKVRLYVAWIEDPDKPPVALDAILDELEEGQVAEGQSTEALEQETGTVVPPLLDADTIEMAKAELQRLRAPIGGQSEILRQFTANLDVPGECYLVGRAANPSKGLPTEEWDVFSVDELNIQGKDVMIVEPGDTTGDKLDPENDFAARMWLRHPRQRKRADSGLRGVLGPCETLLLADRTVRSILKSRTSAGMLLVPEELSFGATDVTEDGSDGDEDKDPFDEELDKVLTTPILDEGAAAAAVPMKVRGKADYLKPDVFRQLELGRKLDPELLKVREDELKRVGGGLDLPVEVITGMASSNHWTAWQIDDSMFRNHLEPLLVAIVDFLTSVFLRPALLNLSVDADVVSHIVVWYDPTPAITRTNIGPDAKYLHENMALSDAAARAALGFDDSDAPDEAELLRRLLSHQRTWDPVLVRYMLQLQFGSTFQPPPPMATGPGGGQVAPGEAPSDDAVSQAQGPPAEEAQPGNQSPGEGPKVPLSVRAITQGNGHRQEFAAQGNGRSHQRPTKLGERLSALDRGLRHRLLGAADAAMRQAMTRAGARVRNKPQTRDALSKVETSRIPNSAVAATLGPSMLHAAGFTEDALLAGSFDDVAQRFDQWTQDAQQRALNILGDEGVIDDAELEQLRSQLDAHRDHAAEWLVGALVALASSRLYNPSPSAPPLGEHEPNVLVPASLLREAMARAGGASNVQQTPSGGLVVDAGARPAGGAVLGEALVGALGAAGFETQSYVWMHDDPSHSFPPHEALDGQEFGSWDDDVLINDEGWPDVEFFYPGDHDGCLCDYVPHLVLTVSDTGEADQAEEADLQEAPT